MSLSETINDYSENKENTEQEPMGSLPAGNTGGSGGPKSNLFECICILGSPYWVQPLRIPESKHRQTLSALDKGNNPPKAKKSIETYKASVPFAALFVAHTDIVVPRLPVERTTKTGFLPEEIQYITVKEGQEVVMTYLEVALLAIEDAFLNKFKYRGVDNGLTVVFKMHSFESKSNKTGPNGLRMPTPCLVASDKMGVSAKKNMVMICQKDPFDPNRPVWGTTPRDMLFKERYEHMWEGRPTIYSRRRDNSPRMAGDAVRTSATTAAAITCRSFLQSRKEAAGLKFGLNLDKPEETSGENGQGGNTENRTAGDSNG